MTSVSKATADSLPALADEANVHHRACEALEEVE